MSLSSQRRSLADRLEQQLGRDAPRTLDGIFEIEPPPLDVFISDKAYLDSPPLSDEQYLAVRHAEQILMADIYPTMVRDFGTYWEPVRFVNFIYLEWGKGSGKDHICRVIVARAANILLSLKDPLNYFGMPSQDYIHMLNVASSSGQAHRAFFSPLLNMVRTSPFFIDKLGHEPGDMSQSIRFTKHLEAVSGHSAAATQEGLNIIVGVCDEISEFRSKEETDRYAKGPRESSNSAESITKMIRSSARTRFPNNFKLCAISYPRFVNDPIQTLRKTGEANNRARGEESKYYVSGPLCTWDVNPRFHGQPMVPSPANPEIMIPEAYLDDYEEDPIDSQAKYECLPPTVKGDLYFRNQQAILDTFSDAKDPEPIEIEYWWGISKEQEKQAAEDGRAPTPGWNVKFTIAPDFYPVEGALYAIHGDIGITTDAAGIAMSHVTDWMVKEHIGENEDGSLATQYERIPIIKNDFTTSFRGDKKASPVPRDVQIRWYLDLCWELLKRGFRVRRFTFDGFQSTSSMQTLESRGIETKRVSTDMNNDAWNTLKDVIYDGRLKAYYRERCRRELLNLVKLPTGRIDHPAAGSKDEADALAGSVVGAIHVGGGEDPDALHRPEIQDDTAVSFSVPGSEIEMPESYGFQSLAF